MKQAEQPRFVAPPGRRIIERPRLLNQLEDTNARTILLIAPAGYGKTTLARQWAEHCNASWFTASPAAADVAVLARSLASSLAGHAPQLVRHVDETVRATENPRRDLDRLRDAFLDHLSADAGVWLVVDDYHSLESSSTAGALIEALARSGSLRLLIASRTRPQWVTAREVVYGELLELRRNELALDDAEVAEVLVDSQAGSPATQEIVGIAHGWPAVIGLAAVAGTPGEPPREGVPQTLYVFLAQESFSKAAPATQDALVSMALLPSLSRDALSSTFGGNADLARQVAQTGLVDLSELGAEIHPLARAFLFDTLRRNPDADRRVRGAIAQALRESAWDEAFALVEAFHLPSELEELMTASFNQLLKSGRIETLERFAHYALTHCYGSTPLIDLIDAEVAFRDGLLGQAQTLAVSAAEQLSPTHPLKARGYILGGTSAAVSFDPHESYRLHSQALDFANSPSDERDALWGQCLALIYLEEDAMAETAQRLESISGGSPEDRIRAATAHLLVSRLTTGVRNIDATIRVKELLDQAPDPRVRTAFSNVCGYVLALQARYTEASNLIESALSDTARFRLSFAKPHLLWTRAFAELGLRQFSRADADLRSVEVAAIEADDVHLELNARVLRARILLAQHRHAEAIEATAPGWDTIPTRAMYGEYLVTRALALAAGGSPEAALQLLPEVRRLTSATEVQTLAAMVQAIATMGTPEGELAAAQAMRAARQRGTWDAIVCGVRAAPGLLKSLTASANNQRDVVAVLQRSRDQSLLRASNLATERGYDRRGTLSPREHEVIDLLRQGLRNREIAKILFISEATVKVHVRHIIEKLGARSRTDAVVRYALIAEETSDGSIAMLSPAGLPSMSGPPNSAVR